MNIKTIRLSHLKRNPDPLKIALSGSEIVKLLEEEKPDTLFLCSTTAGLIGSISSYFYKKQHKMRVIYRIGGWAFHDPRNWFLNKLILAAEKATAPLKDKIIVNSEFDYKAALENNICPPDKIVKIHNGIDAERLEFTPKDEALNFLSEKTGMPLKPGFLVGCVANFYRTKGLKHLIGAIGLLETKYRPLDVKCIIVGEGKQGPKLKQLVKNLKLENKLFFTGRIPEAYKYLKAFDAFVLPSLKEGFPWIILEAMAAEIPAIATKVGALTEIIENEEAMLVEPGSPEQIAQSIKSLAEDSKLREKLTNRAKRRLNEFSASKMVEQTKRFF